MLDFGMSWLSMMPVYDGVWRRKWQWRRRGEPNGSAPGWAFRAGFSDAKPLGAVLDVAAPNIAAADCLPHADGMAGQGRAWARR
jgi:hypothetical protein